MAGESEPSRIRMRLDFTEMPVDLAVALMSAIDRAVERQGFTAYFLEETGFNILYFSRIRTTSDQDVE
jgi:hypothetical protein